jgi:hypothetical protein
MLVASLERAHQLAFEWYEEAILTKIQLLAHSPDSTQTSPRQRVLHHVSMLVRGPNCQTCIYEFTHLDCRAAGLLRVLGTKAPAFRAAASNPKSSSPCAVSTAFALRLQLSCNHFQVCTIAWAVPALKATSIHPPINPSPKVSLRQPSALIQARPCTTLVASTSLHNQETHQELTQSTLHPVACSCQTRSCSDLPSQKHVYIQAASTCWLQLKQCVMCRWLHPQASGCWHHASMCCSSCDEAHTCTRALKPTDQVGPLSSCHTAACPKAHGRKCQSQHWSSVLAKGIGLT